MNDFTDRMPFRRTTQISKSLFFNGLYFFDNTFCYSFCYSLTQQPLFYPFFNVKSRPSITDNRLDVQLEFCVTAKLVCKGKHFLSILNFFFAF